MADTTTYGGAPDRWAAVCLLVVAAWTTVPTLVASQEPETEVPFVPTPMEVVHDILDLAGTTASDTVYDLGSGDGRIPIEAARKYGAAGVGVELDSSLVAMSRRKAREAGVAEKVRFVQGDLFETDLRPASVLTLYLNTPFNLRLRSRILEQMEAGSRVVSHVFDMGQWQADTVVQRIEFGAFLYRWTVPADVEGRWRVTLDSGEQAVVKLDQKFQNLCVVGGSGEGAPAPGTGGGSVDGESVLFPVAGLEGREVALPVRGTASGDRMTGWTAEGVGWTGVRIGEVGGSLERWDPPDSGAAGSPCATDREEGAPSSPAAPGPSGVPLGGHPPVLHRGRPEASALRNGVSRAGPLAGTGIAPSEWWRVSTKDPGSAGSPDSR